MNLTLRQIRSAYLAIKFIDAGYPAEVKDDKGNERVANLPFKVPTKARYSLARNHAIFEPIVVVFEKTIAAKVKEAAGDQVKIDAVEAEGQAMLDQTEELAKVFTISETDYADELCAQPIPSSALAAILPLVA